MPEERYSLKDELFNSHSIKKITDCIDRVYDLFDATSFYNEIMDEMMVLELKERVTLIRQKLEKYMPDNYLETIKLLHDSLKSTESKGDFVFASYSEYIEMNGCTDDYLDISLDMLGEYTKWFSVEFSIRKFINQYPDQTYKKMLEWSLSDHVDQRRLSSEGLRPKLPWSSKINFDYHKGLLPLHNLYYDKERYVVRSVANHLNDISKLDPDLVVETLRLWQSSHKQEPKEMDYLIHHSLRTSIKKGHIKSLAFIGYHENPEILISNFSISNKSLVIGDSLEFEFSVLSPKPEKLMIDFKVLYPMAHNKTSEKVFKIKKVTLKENELITIKKSHAFKVMTTKKLYSGDYKISLQINGKIYNEDHFSLTV